MLKKILMLAVFIFLGTACDRGAGEAAPETSAGGPRTPYLVVLGVAQDGGRPHAGCERACCRPAWEDAGRQRLVSCLGLVDPATSQRWLLDATPDLARQLHLLDRQMLPSGEQPPASPPPSGIFLTHGHIGHYTGLAQLGREVMGSHRVPVYAMPRMAAYLQESGPWEQLVRLENIEIRQLQDHHPVTLNSRLSVTPLLVPHRDEYTETVGFLITGPDHSALYLPDIDKWEKWQTSLEEVLAGVQVAYIDGSFFSAQEVPGRDMSEIPHPSIPETMERLSHLPEAERRKVRFIHLNHTNPALDLDSAAAREIMDAGFHLAVEGEHSGL